MPVLQYGVKTFRFSWTDIPGSTHYRVLENPDGVSGFNQVSGDIAQGVQAFDLSVPVHQRINARYILQTCNGAGCTDSASIGVAGALVGAIGYFKASNTGAEDNFGRSVSLSADGNTLAVGADEEDSNATGVDGDQSNNSAVDSGAVYVFARSGNAWTQQAYLKASNTDAGDLFGTSVSLSADGNTLAVGAIFEDSNAVGVGGDEDNDSVGEAGAVYVFSRTGSNWSQQAYLKGAATGVADFFGVSVSLSADGNALAVGATGEDGDAMGVGGDPDNNDVSGSGAVFVYSRNVNTWLNPMYIKPSNTGEDDAFGTSVSLSADGDTLAVGAFAEASNATGVGGNQNDDTSAVAGAVYAFTRIGGGFVQQAYLKASNTDAGDQFGVTVGLSADGDTLAVGARLEASNATGVNGNQADDSEIDAGAAYVFTRSGTDWTQQAYLKASNAGAHAGFGDTFGSALSLSDDGDTLAVGARFEDSNAVGVDGDQTDNSAAAAGAVYLFARSGSAWSQQAYLKASNAGNGQFGASVSVSADGESLAAGAGSEHSNATGIGGDQTNSAAPQSGAVYVY